MPYPARSSAFNVRCASAHSQAAVAVTVVALGIIISLRLRGCGVHQVMVSSSRLKAETQDMNLHSLVSSRRNRHTAIFKCPS